MISKKYDKIMMETAKLFAKQSYCERRQVGAVLAKDGRILATGYNGTISGHDNDCEDRVIKLPCCGKEVDVKEIMEHYAGLGLYNYECDCKPGMTKYVYEYIYLENVKPVTNEFTLHAEQNVITYCAKEGIPTKDTTIYITTSPCKQCAKLIAQSGIKTVVYAEEYKDTSGIDFLKKVNIEIKQVK